MNVNSDEKQSDIAEAQKSGANSRDALLLVMAKLVKALRHKQCLLERIDEKLSGGVVQVAHTTDEGRRTLDGELKDLREVNAYIEFFQSYLADGIATLLPDLATKEGLRSLLARQCEGRASEMVEEQEASGELPTLWSGHLRRLVTIATSVLVSTQAMESTPKVYAGDYRSLLDEAAEKMQSQVSEANRPLFEKTLLPQLTKLRSMLARK